jgi:hypothetical protein
VGAVHRYSAPAYPTLPEASADPSLLAPHVPPGWLVDGVAGATALLVAASGAGCGGPPAPPKRPLSPDSPAVVAPLFAHGEGRGAAGCVVVAPPEFLSEEEASQVIEEELRRGGLTAGRRRETWREVRVANGFRPEEVRPLEVDVLGADRRVAVVFVSEDRYAALGGMANRWATTVRHYDFRSAANELGRLVQQHKRGVYFGVLYDPMVLVRRSERLKYVPPEARPKNYESSMQAASRKAKNLLRLQVQDFISWLKAQGAI